MTMGCQWSGIGPVPEVIEALEADTITFAANDIVLLSAGVVTIGTVDSVFGVAQKASTYTNTSKATIPVQVITPETIWIMQADDTTTATMPGEDYNIIYTTGVQYLDVGSTDSTQARMERLDSRDGATSGAGGRVHIRFKDDIIKDMVT